ncbi:YfiR family protein [Gayadomonas joobiniege]|uniref:YfiR family protein n=1 Tax=Gayadomonas joobiniege TaxID=1234606 RepID=UPI0003663B4F|nr:YfiR family protein [Gayadomonas joobiniege]
MNLKFSFGLILGLIFLTSLLFPVAANPSISQPDEVSLRAAVIVGVLRYTQLNLEEYRQNIQICGWHNPISGGKLKAVAPNLTVGNRNLIYIALQSDAELQARHCDVVVIGEGDSETTNILKSNSIPALTICDGCQTGIENSVLELIRIKNKIRFNVNLELAEKVNIKFSSSLLELANKIKGR